MGYVIYEWPSTHNNNLFESLSFQCQTKTDLELYHLQRFALLTPENVSQCKYCVIWWVPSMTKDILDKVTKGDAGTQQTKKNQVNKWVCTCKYDDQTCKYEDDHILRYWTFISFFYLLTCFNPFRYLSINCYAFIGCYIIWF